jgi:hypothetical protein
VQLVEENEKKIYSMIWVRMSPASQSRLREEEWFEEARLSLDCVAQWGMIRATHLTHICWRPDERSEFPQARNTVFIHAPGGERVHLHFQDPFRQSATRERRSWRAKTS